jgi:phage/plasmid-associated DNA primase
MDQAQHRKLYQAQHHKADRAQHRHRADHSAVPPQAGDNSLNRLRSWAVVAEELLRWMHEHDEDICIVADEKGHEHTWLYKAGLWRLAAKPASFLETQIETRLQERKVRWLSTARFVTEVRKYIERSPKVRPSEIIAWDNHGKIATRSGLIDPVTLKIEPLQKQHYATWRIEIDYDPTAKCPLFLELLDDYFNDQGAEEREKQITLLQDFAGTMLIDLLPKALKRALVLLGASDTGKSTLLRTLWRILTDKPISTSFAELSGPHGLEEFVRRAPWVLDEAFNISVWHLSDRVKSVISRDTLTINPKNQPLLTKPVFAPCLWGTNHPPTFKENTEAMVNRLLIERLTRVFDKDNPAGVAIKAKAANPAWEPDDLIHEREKAGLLNWMLAGLKRVLERGNFVNTTAGLIALNEMRLDANPVYGFIRDCVMFDPDAMMSTTDFCAAFLGWREATHGDDKTSHGPHFIGKNLAALSHPRIGQNKDVFKEQDGRRFYVGIALDVEGRAHFDAVATTRYQRPESWLKRISLASGEVRQVIPEKWLGDAEVVKLKKRLPDED